MDIDTTLYDWAPSLKEAQVGQSVWVYNGQGGRHRDVYRAEIIKRGTKLLTIERHGRERTFKIEDGKDSKHTSRTPGPASYLMTESQVAANNAVTEAIETIRSVGLEFKLGFTWPNARIIKLATLIKEGSL